MKAVRRLSLPLCRSFVLAMVLSCATAFAQDAAPAGGYVIKQHAPTTVPNLLMPNWSLSVTGSWPTQCPPTLQSVSLNGDSLRIDARSILGLCEKKPMQFSIELNPALALDRSELPSGVYHVSFYAADGAQATPRLRAFALIDRSAPNIPKILPETGFWWSSNGNGTKADRTIASIELQADQLSVSLMSYDESGRPLWYFGAAPFDGHVAHLALLRLSGGSTPFSSVSEKPRGEAALTLDLQFASNAHATAWLSRPLANGGLQLQSLDLVRLALADSNDGRAWQGDWVLVSDVKGTPPQRLRLDSYSMLDPAHFTIQSDAGNAVLTCTIDPSQPEWPPGACVLHLTGQAGALTFNSVAINHMDGSDDNQADVHLLRISR